MPKAEMVKSFSLILDFTLCQILNVFYYLKVVRRTARLLSSELSSLGVWIIEVKACPVPRFTPKWSPWKIFLVIPIHFLTISSHTIILRDPLS